MAISIVPRPVPAGTPSPRPIRALNRKTGLTITLVPSTSVAGKYYIVGTDRCDCRGFQATGRCRHLRLVQAERAAQPLPCAACRLYHLTAAERARAHPDANRDLAPGGAAWLRVQRAAGSWPS